MSIRLVVFDNRTHSNESGQAEAYVTSFPRPGRKWQVSRIFPHRNRDPAVRRGQVSDGALTRDLQRLRLAVQQGADEIIPRPWR